MAPKRKRDDADGASLDGVLANLSGSGAGSGASCSPKFRLTPAAIAQLHNTVRTLRQGGSDGSTTALLAHLARKPELPEVVAALSRALAVRAPHCLEEG